VLRFDRCVNGADVASAIGSATVAYYRLNKTEQTGEGKALK